MYQSTKDIFSQYWAAYGGFSALLKSPYFHASLLTTLLTFKAWNTPTWYEIVFKVIPALLGFSLGSFSLFISFGDEKFRRLLNTRDENSDQTTYIKFCAVFVHFILVQLLALIFAVIYDGWSFNHLFNSTSALFSFISLCFSAIGFLLFLYALFLMLAVTMHIFRLARLFSLFKQ